MDTGVGVGTLEGGGLGGGVRGKGLEGGPATAAVAYGGRNEDVDGRALRCDNPTYASRTSWASRKACGAQPSRTACVSRTSCAARWGGGGALRIGIGRKGPSLSAVECAGATLFGCSATLGFCARSIPSAASSDPCVGK